MKTKGLLKACALLDREITRIEQQKRSQLPPLRTLAAQAGVCVVTMHKAASLYAKQGRIVMIHGSGIFLPKAAHLKKPLPGFNAKGEYPARLGWHRVYDYIVNEIQNGRFEPGTLLPSRKELCHHLGTSNATISRAMQLLCAQRLVEQWRKSYRIPDIRCSTFRQVVAVVLPGVEHSGYTPLGNTFHTNLSNYPRMGDTLQAIELECNRKGIQLLFITWNKKGKAWYLNGKTIRLNGSYVKAQNLAGLILLDIGINKQELFHICTSLQNLEVPLVILEEGNNDIFLRQTMPSLNILLAGTTPRSGYLAAKHLLAIGHRHIAYLAPTHDYPGLIWSELRLKGIKQALDESPYKSFLYPFTDSTPHLFDLQGIFMDFLTQNGLALIQKAFDDNNDSMDYSAVLLRTLCLRQQELCHFMVHEHLYAQLTATMEHVLENRDITVWVCQNDFVALTALRFLEERGIAVPKRISLLGFDNTPLARSHCMASYDFNQTQIARMLVGLALKDTHAWELFRRRHSAEIDGIIHERGTLKNLRTARRHTKSPVISPMTE